MIAGESFLLHDYRGQGRVLDRFESELRVERPGGAVLARDRFDLSGELLKAGLPGVSGSWAAHGSLVVVARVSADTIVDGIRGRLDATPGIYAGVSTLRDSAGAWTRFLAEDGLALRRGMLAAWSAAREAVTGLVATPRRK